jgi:hypothetical protein
MYDQYSILVRFKIFIFSWYPLLTEYVCTVLLCSFFHMHVTYQCFLQKTCVSIASKSSFSHGTLYSLSTFAQYYCVHFSTRTSHTSVSCRKHASRSFKLKKFITEDRIQNTEYKKPHTKAVWIRRQIVFCIPYEKSMIRFDH